MKYVIIIALLLSTGLLCFLLAAPFDGTPQNTVREYVHTHGPGDTGALNLVTAIYLGYRAFDTLGETVVLLLAVIGVNILFVKQR